MVRRAILPALALLALLSAGPALACPGLEHAEPRVGSTIQSSPPQIILHFGGEIDPTGSTITVTDASGHNWAKGETRSSGHPVDTVSVGIPPLPPGLYKVTWRIPCHCDGDTPTIIPGGYSFRVDPSQKP